MTGALKMYFRELKEPLIPWETVEPMYEAFAEKDYESIKAVMETMPEVNKDTLEVLIEHLFKVTEHEMDNKMGVSNISAVFAPSLMWSSNPTSLGNLALGPSVIRGFITHHKNVFEPQKQVTVQELLMEEHNRNNSVRHGALQDDPECSGCPTGNVIKTKVKPTRSRSEQYATDKHLEDQEPKRRNTDRPNRPRRVTFKEPEPVNLEEPPTTLNEDHPRSPQVDDQNRKIKKTTIKKRLTKLINERPAFSELVDRGILKRELVFGSKLTASGQVPEFVVQCIRHIESGDRLSTPGLYQNPGG